MTDFTIAEKFAGLPVGNTVNHPIFAAILGLVLFSSLSCALSNCARNYVYGDSYVLNTNTVA